MLSFSARLSGGDVTRRGVRAKKFWRRLVNFFGHRDLAHFGPGNGRTRARSSGCEQRGHGQDDRFAHGTSPLITSRTRSASTQDRTSAFESSPARVRSEHLPDGVGVKRCWRWGLYREPSYSKISNPTWRSTM